VSDKPSQGVPDSMPFVFTIYVTHSQASVPVAVWGYRLSVNYLGILRHRLLRDMRILAMIRCVAALKALVDGLRGRWMESPLPLRYAGRFVGPAQSSSSHGRLNW
jgi:hypothetical protein